MLITVPGLTATQIYALAFGSEYSELSDNYACRPGDTYRESTLKALERKGYLSKNFHGTRWLTDIGNQVRTQYWQAHQKAFPEQYLND